MDSGQGSVPLSLLAHYTAGDASVDLRNTCQSIVDESEDSRKKELLKYLHRTKQKLLKLLAVTQWAKQAPLIEKCQQVEGSLSHHDICMMQAADSLYALHDDLQRAKAPIYDVPTAIEILTTGRYKKLPKRIEDIRNPSEVSSEDAKDGLSRVDIILRSRLLTAVVPSSITSISIANGKAMIEAVGLYRLSLSIGFAGNFDLWQVLDVELLVGSSKGDGSKTASRTGEKVDTNSVNRVKLTEFQIAGIVNDLCHRMVGKSDPFSVFHPILSEICSAIVLDTITQQLRVLQHGLWQQMLRFEEGEIELDSDSMRSFSFLGSTSSASKKVPCLKVRYWIGGPLKGRRTDVSLPPPQPIISIVQGESGHLVCTHEPQVIDPATGEEVKLAVDSSSVDAKKLVLSAIKCSVHTRLLEVYRQLKGHSSMASWKGNVILCFDSPDMSKADLGAEEFGALGDFGSQESEETLWLRVCGNLFVGLCVDSRHGRFYLRLSENSFFPNVLRDLERKLAFGFLTAADTLVEAKFLCLVQRIKDWGLKFGLKAMEDSAVLKCKALQTGGGRMLSLRAALFYFPGEDKAIWRFLMAVELDGNFSPNFRVIKQSGNLEDLNPSRPVRTAVDVGQYIRLQLGLFAPRKPAPEAEESEMVPDYVRDPDAEDMEDNSEEMVDADASRSESKKRAREDEVSEDFTAAKRPMAAVSDTRTFSEDEYVPAIASAVEQSFVFMKLDAVTEELARINIPFSYAYGFTAVSTALELKLPWIETSRVMNDALKSWARVEMVFDGLQNGQNHASIDVKDVYFAEMKKEGQRRTNFTTFPRYSKILPPMAEDYDEDLSLLCTNDGLRVKFNVWKPECVSNSVSLLNMVWRTREFAMEAKKALSEGSHRGNVLRFDVLGPTKLCFSVWSLLKGKVASIWIVWKPGAQLCQIKCIPDNIFPHTRFLEEMATSGDVLLFLDTISITGEPLSAINAALRPVTAARPAGTQPLAPVTALSPQVPLILSPCLPLDASLILRSPFCARLVYRNRIAVDIKFFAGSHVFLQPVPSLLQPQTAPMGPPGERAADRAERRWSPCPQLRVFLMDLVSGFINQLEVSSMQQQSQRNLQQQSQPSQYKVPAQGTHVQDLSDSLAQSSVQMQFQTQNLAQAQRQGQGGRIPGQRGQSQSQGRNPFFQVLGSLVSGSGSGSPGSNENVHPAGVSEEGSFGGVWVPVLVLKRCVLALMRYLGSMYLLSQVPTMLRPSLVVERDFDLPAIKVHIGDYDYRLILSRQKRAGVGDNPQIGISEITPHKYPNRPADQQPVNQYSQEDMATLADFFARLVTCEPYSLSRMSSFFTLLLLPHAVLKDFIAFIGSTCRRASQARPKKEEEAAGVPKFELALESKCDIDRTQLNDANKSFVLTQGAVEFNLSFTIDRDSFPPSFNRGALVSGGGSEWAPFCVVVRLAYALAGPPIVKLVSARGSHGGKAWFTRAGDWDRLKSSLSVSVDSVFSGRLGAGVPQVGSRIGLVAKALQTAMYESICSSNDIIADSIFDLDSSLPLP